MTTGGIRSFSPSSNGGHPLKWLDKKKRHSLLQPTIGEDIELVTLDHTVKTEPHENRKRRTLVISKADGQKSWGFTVQSYGIQQTQTRSVDTLTYVDYVEMNSPAYLAGMMAGDVILSINGTPMETADHTELVAFIRGCQDVMRIVVLFEDCCRKVELHLKLRKLKKLLAAKMFEFNSLERRERNLLEGRKDSLSLHSTSMLSLLDDSYSLLPEEDVFTQGLSFTPAASYASLPRNFSLQQRGQSEGGSGCLPSAGGYADIPASSDRGESPLSSSSGESSVCSNGVNLSDSYISSPIISLNPRVDHRYTSLPPDMRKRSVQKSDRKIGNSLFYGEWLSEHDSPNDHRPATECRGSALSRDSGMYQTWTGGSRSRMRSSTRSIGNSLFYVDSDGDVSGSDTESLASTIEYGGSQNCLDQRDTNDSLSGVRNEDGSATNGEKTADNPNLVIKMRNKKDSSPIRPVSLPNLECLGSFTPVRDSGIDSPVFVEEPESSRTGVSDWIASDSCDIKRSNSPVNRHSNESKTNSVRGRKNTVSTGSVGLGGGKLPSGELSRSMGNLSTTERSHNIKKSPTSPLLKSFTNWAPFKFTRSKIRHSLSRLRNRSSSYNVAEKKAEPQMDSDLESSDYYNNQSSDHNAFSGIEAYATLPKRPKILKPNANRPCSATEQMIRGSSDSTRTVNGDANLKTTMLPNSCTTENDKVDKKSSNVSGLYEEVMDALDTRTGHKEKTLSVVDDTSIGLDAENNNDYKVFVDVCKAFDQVDMYSSTETLTGVDCSVSGDEITDHSSTLSALDYNTDSGVQEPNKIPPNSAPPDNQTLSVIAVDNTTSTRNRDSTQIACDTMLTTDLDSTGVCESDRKITNDQDKPASRDNEFRPENTRSSDKKSTLLTQENSISTRPKSVATPQCDAEFNASTSKLKNFAEKPISQRKTKTVREEKDTCVVPSVKMNVSEKNSSSEVSTKSKRSKKVKNPKSCINSDKMDQSGVKTGGFECSSTTSTADRRKTPSTGSPGHSTVVHDALTSNCSHSQHSGTCSCTLSQKLHSSPTKSHRQRPVAKSVRKPSLMKSDVTQNEKSRNYSSMKDGVCLRGHFQRTSSTESDISGKHSTINSSSAISKSTSAKLGVSRYVTNSSRQSNSANTTESRNSAKLIDDNHPRTDAKQPLNTNKVEFFSRNMTPVYSEEENETSGHVFEPASREVDRFTSLTKPDSPKRFVIQLKRTTQDGASASDHYDSSWSQEYKRRFYTYEEIPAMKSEYSLVNAETCETWL